MRPAIDAEVPDSTFPVSRANPTDAAPTPEPMPDTFRFADCEVRIPSREIIRGGVVQRVERLSFDLIVYLIANRERVVTKDELLRSVWRNMFVSDSVITQGIMKARRVLADDGRGRSFIRTVHRVGYRFDDHVLYAVPTARESVSASVPQIVLISHPADLDEPGRQAVALATGILARELAPIGLVVRYVGSDESSGANMRFPRRA